jgi:hypothetical protein
MTRMAARKQPSHRDAVWKTLRTHNTGFDQVVKTYVLLAFS